MCFVFFQRLLPINQITDMAFTKKSPVLVLVLVLSFFASCTKNNPTDAGTSPTVPAKVLLLAPGNLQFISLSATEAILKWTDNSSNETAFIIEQSTDSVLFAPVATVGANIDSATVSGTFLTVNTYYFRVRGKNADTTTAASNMVRKTLLPPPTNLKMTAFTFGTASLQWTDNSTNETGFYIERSVDASPYVRIDSTGANTTSKSVAGPYDSTKTYSFRISARSGSNTSGYSNAVAQSLGPWVFVVGATYQMGRSNGTRDEQPVHTVTLSNFYIGKYEVTVKEYRQYTTATGKAMPTPPANGWVDNGPIVNVTWNDADAYCQWVDSTSNKTVRLPTEAEWEFAARGGVNTQNCAYSGSNTVGDVAWYYLNSNNYTNPVGTKLPNELGIYDMSGNAWEWVYDWQGSYSYLAQINPKGPTLGGTYKVFRGGSWFNYGLAENECRVETRYFYSPGSKVSDGGFRIVKTQL